MGKYADAAMAILILIIGLYIFTKLGLSMGEIWKMLKQFFYGTGTGSSGMIALSISNAKMRKKIEKHQTHLKRDRSIFFLSHLIFSLRKRGE